MTFVIYINLPYCPSTNLSRTTLLIADSGKVSFLLK